MVTGRLKQVVVVLVDDEPGVRSAMKLLLEAFGYRVEAYASADDALAHSSFCRSRLLTESPERGSNKAIIVSDVRMPGLDGFQFLERVRGSGVKFPFVLVSGHASKDELSRGLALGAQGFLTKPYDPEDLRAMLEDLSEEHPVEQQANGQARMGH